MSSPDWWETIVVKMFIVDHSRGRCKALEGLMAQARSLLKQPLAGILSGVQGLHIPSVF